jgi:hypothetical protein
MKLSFGIREKTTLLVAAATYFAPKTIVNFVMAMYEDCEAQQVYDS